MPRVRKSPIKLNRSSCRVGFSIKATPPFVSVRAVLIYDQASSSRHGIESSMSLSY
jgi:hypothetical protein